MAADYLLDSNHAATLVTTSHPLRKRVMDRMASGDRFWTCVPVVTETVFGLGMLPRATENLTEWSRLEVLMPCLRPGQREARLAGELQVTLRRRGWQLATVDALIAVVALRSDLVLLTTDKDFLAVPDLRHENWRES